MVMTAQYMAVYGPDMKVTGHDCGSRFSRKLLRHRAMAKKIVNWFSKHNIKIKVVDDSTSGANSDTK